MALKPDQVLAFRLTRSGLAERRAGDLAEAAHCPASDFDRDAALLALGARVEDISREGYERAVDAGKLLLAHVIRGAIHTLAPSDHSVFGRSLVSEDSTELGGQLGQQVKRLAEKHGLDPGDALREVAEATRDALKDGRALTKNELHEEYRSRVRAELMPWCRGCGSHHVAPMLWRYATVKAGARLDSQRRYRMGRPGRAQAVSEALRRFLKFYGPATPGDFADWAGLARSHAGRLWDEVENDLVEVPVGKRRSWLLAADATALESPPDAAGVRLLPPGDPYLQKPNRPLLAPDKGLGKRLFRPVASPGAVLKDGRLVGMWRVKLKSGRAEFTVEKLGRLARRDVEEEAQRVGRLRGAAEARIEFV